MINEIKERIALAKFILGLMIGLLFALIGWMASSYKVVDSGLLVMSAILVVIFVYGSVLLLKYILVKIRELRDL